MASRHAVAGLLSLSLLGCGDPISGGPTCGDVSEYYGGSEVPPFTVGHEPWCVDCPFKDMATLDPGFVDYGFTSRVVMSEGGNAALIAMGPFPQNQAVWAAPYASDEVTPMPGVALGAAFAMGDEGVPYVLFPTKSPHQLRLREPSGVEEIVSCPATDQLAHGLGIAIEPDGLHAIAASSAEMSLNQNVMAYARGADGNWREKELGQLNYGPVAVARAANGAWLAIGQPALVHGKMPPGQTMLREDEEARQIDIPSPVMEEDYEGTSFQPHPRLQILPGEDDYFAVLSVGDGLVTVLFADGRRIEIPKEQSVFEECSTTADHCLIDCTTLGSATMAATAFVDGDNLFVVMSEYAVDALTLFDCQPVTGGPCDCTETLDHDEQQARLVIARYDLATLSGGVVLEQPIPSAFPEIWMSAIPVGDDLLVAFRELSDTPVRVGTLDMAMLRAL